MSFSTDEIAKGARTTLRGVRLWESAGLLGDVPRNENGHRVFSEAHMQRARLISAAQMAGMSIAEIRSASDSEFYETITRSAIFLNGVATSLFRATTPGFDL